MSAPNLDLNHVDTFVRVVEAQSFTAAAKALGVPKSTVSRRVTALEASLGVRLLRRTTRKLSLTDAGTSFYARVSSALASVYEASTAASDSDGEPRGAVRITAPVDFGIDPLPGILARFAAQYPCIYVETVLTPRRVDMVEEGFDLAVRAGKMADSSLVARKVANGEARLFASPAYLAKAGTPKKLSDLLKHQFVMFRPKNGEMEMELEGPRGAETLTVKGPIGVDDFGFVREAVMAGAGIGLIPSLGCRSQVLENSLVPVLPKYSQLGGNLYVVYPSARHLPQRVSVLRDFLLKELTIYAEPAATRIARAS